MKAQKLLSSFVISASLIVFASIWSTSVSAQGTLENVQERRGEIIENRCERVTNRVDFRIERYDERKDDHIEKYNNIKTRVTNLVNDLDTKGYDTSAVREDLNTLDSKIKDFASSYTEFVDALELSKTYACGNSEGQFKAQIETSLKELRESREIAKSTIEFIRNDLKKSISDLKNQNPNS